MGKNITLKKIVGFMAVFCLLFSVMNIPFYPFINDGYQYLSILRKSGQVADLDSDCLDVIFLGDSECWSSISPLQLLGEYGIASYNCSTSGQWAGDSLVMLNKVLKNQKPSVVVLGANTLFNQVNPYKYMLSKMVPILHYHNVYSDDNKKGGDAAFLGANLSEFVVPYTGSENYMENSVSAQPLEGMMQEKLNGIFQLCQDNGIQLIMISSPSALNWTQGKHDSIENWCTANSVDYIDYNEKSVLEKIAFDWSTDTRDGGDHVNLSGSKKVTSDIGNILKNKFSLKDHRGESEYSEWLEDYLTMRIYKNRRNK